MRKEARIVRGLLKPGFYSMETLIGGLSVQYLANANFLENHYP